MLLSVEEMRLCSDVSKTAVPEGSAAPRLGPGVEATPNRELIKVATPINAEVIACSMPHMVRSQGAL
jgi:hypothetical protein